MLLLLYLCFIFYVYFVLCIDCILFKCYLTGFYKINHDMHMECMSIVTDATQNQNGSTLTKSEIMVFLPEVALVNLLK